MTADAGQRVTHACHVECGSAGNALDGHAIDVATGPLGDLADALLGRGLRKQEDQIEAVLT